MISKQPRTKRIGILVGMSAVLALGGPVVFEQPTALSWCKAMGGYSSFEAQRQAIRRQVTEDQTTLRQLGYYKGNLDGQAGPRTRQAIRNFRKENGLPDGVELDARSRSLLGSGRAKAMPDRSAEMRAARQKNMEDQRELQRLGYYEGKIDGVPGPKTQAAVADFRSAHGLGSGTRLEGKSREVLHGGGAQSKSTWQNNEIKSVTQADQQALADLGYYDGAVDGVPGPRTRAGIRSFKQKYDMDATHAKLGSSARATLREAQAEVRWIREANGDGVSVVMVAPQKGAYRMRTATGEFVYEADGAAEVQKVIGKILNNGKVQKVYVDASRLPSTRLESFKETLRMLPESSVRFISVDSRNLLFSRSVEMVGASSPSRLSTGFWRSKLDLVTPNPTTAEVSVIGRTKELTTKFIRRLRDVYSDTQKPKSTLGGALNRVREHLRSTRDIKSEADLRIEIMKSLKDIEVVGP